MNDLFFSIIIPFYNEQEDIVNTVSSCLNQSISDDYYEIILVDDGSTDSSYHICLEHYHGIQNVKLLHYSNNQGVAFARNYGVSSSKGDVLVFLNADEILSSDFLSLICKNYQKGADYVFPQTRVRNVNTGYGSFRECYRQYKYNMPNKFLWSQGFSCRREIFLKVNGFNENYPGCGGEDWDLTTRIDRLAANRVVDLSIIVEHRVPESVSDILWHIYNRGRGSAYFDLLGTRKNPKKYILKCVLSGIGTAVLAAWRLDYLLLLIVIHLLSYLKSTYQMASYLVEKSRYASFWAFAILDKAIRKMAYFITMAQNLHRKDGHH